MEFIPYDKDSNAPTGTSLADLTRSVLMSIYQEKNPDASEDDIDKIRDEIETLILETKQWFERTMLPIKATIKLAEKQYISLGCIDENLADEIMLTDNLDALLNENAEIRKHTDIAIAELRKADFIKPYEALFSQTITAYESELYDLSVLGFFAIIDGLLSDITKDHGSVKIKQRMEKAVNVDGFHVPKDDAAINMAMQKASLLMVSELLSESKPFSGVEPDVLNRHWAMHGRTRTKKTKADCEKLILFIYGLISSTRDSIGEFN